MDQAWLAKCLVKELYYDAGTLRWSVSKPAHGLRTRKSPGDIATVAFLKGRYLSVSYRNKGFLAHRLVWLIIHGVWPTIHVDHVNGDGTDNLVSNLRLATPTQNSHNSAGVTATSSKYKGVTWAAHANKWRAQLRRNGKSHIGYFTSERAAALAYNAVALKYHKEFARLNVI